VLLVVSAIAVGRAQGQIFKVLHTFKGSDGAGPIGQLVRDKAGNLYGVAAIGGAGKCQGGCGTVFKMDKRGKLIWLHSFNGKNGIEPYAGLLRDSAGDFYGTTVFGGIVNNHICSLGCGVAFKLDKTGKSETMLHKFAGTPDGYFPQAPLVEDSAGNLYGTTDLGGQEGSGAVFKIDATGTETLLYSFTGGPDGCFPYSGVILDAAGDLYGVTLDGGAGFGNSGYGVVFKIDTAGNETVLHTFEGSDGANPDSALLFDSQGNLYGTTDRGGSSNVCNGGCGTVFELSPQNGSWSETVLYSFCSLSDCADGMRPGVGPLVKDAAGNLFGTTDFGSTYNNCNGTCGVVFKLDTAGRESVLHDFTGGADGTASVAGLTIDSAGNLYGAAVAGGNLACKDGNGLGCGTVFKITP
jgi:uncharacterized repeat protein (TIGR03803 family)